MGWMPSSDFRTANMDETRIVPIPNTVGPMIVLISSIFTMSWGFGEVAYHTGGVLESARRVK
jgi:hypothetical protein